MDVARGMKMGSGLLYKWMQDPLFKTQMAEYSAVRDQAVATSLTEMATADGKPGPSARARTILKAAEAAAAKAITDILSTGTPKQKYEAATEILKLTGHYTHERAAGLVINITAGELQQKRQAAIDLGLAEPVKRLPEVTHNPNEAPETASMSA